MGTSRIDGKVEAVWLKRKRAKFAVYDRIAFTLPDGRTRTVGKSLVGSAVAERLVPGTSGRFYLYSAIDHQGIHGFRDGDGEAAFAFPTVNETAMLVVVAINLVWLAVAIAALGQVPLIALVLTVVGVPLYFLYRNTRMEARRQFDADAAYAPSPADAAPAPAAEPALGG